MLHALFPTAPAHSTMKHCRNSVHFYISGFYFICIFFSFEELYNLKSGRKDWIHWDWTTFQKWWRPKTDIKLNWVVHDINFPFMCPCFFSSLTFANLPIFIIFLKRPILLFEATEVRGQAVSREHVSYTAQCLSHVQFFWFHNETPCDSKKKSNIMVIYNL